MVCVAEGNRGNMQLGVGRGKSDNVMDDQSASRIKCRSFCPSESLADFEGNTKNGPTAETRISRKKEEIEQLRVFWEHRMYGRGKEKRLVVEMGWKTRGRQCKDVDVPLKFVGQISGANAVIETGDVKSCSGTRHDGGRELSRSDCRGETGGRSGGRRSTIVGEQACRGSGEKEREEKRKEQKKRKRKTIKNQEKFKNEPKSRQNQKRQRMMVKVPDGKVGHSGLC